jgi:hypothetical protein
MRAWWRRRERFCRKSHLVEVNRNELTVMPKVQAGAPTLIVSRRSIQQKKHSGKVMPECQ